MLYLHIPFCKQACSYCNFHFSTSMKTRPAVLDGMLRELRLRRGELPAGPVPSIYFGGGTPSLLTGEELAAFFEVFERSGYWGADAGAVGGSEEQGGVLVPFEPDGRTKGRSPNALPTGSTEITLEANPDDLDARTIATLAASPVNRLSIGIQSFFEEDLRFMNRAHSAAEARTAVEKVNRAGFHDVSIDLIYGGQTTTDAMWAENLRIATDLGVTHISAYAFTVEPKTALGARVERGEVPDTDDAKFARQFGTLIDHLTRHGYEHYEVSNFALPGHRSRHNSGYWAGGAYLGIGPGAHGFDGHATRRWNVDNNATYAKAFADIHTPAAYVAAENLLYERETLSHWDRYNEYVMTALRRAEGLTLEELHARFGAEAVPYFSKSQAANVEAGLFEPGTDAGRYRLTRAGIMRADGVASDGFWIE